MLSCARELLVRGIPHEARAVLGRLLEQDTHCPDAIDLLACSCEASRAWHHAIEAWEHQLSLDSRNARALGRLGALYSMLGNWERARSVYSRAVALQPEQPLHLVGLASANLALENFTELERTRDQLLARFPEHPQSHLIDGHSHKIAGRTARAVAAYRAALEADPGMTDAMFNLSELSPPPPQSEFARRLQELRRGALPARDRANVCFALAKVLDAAECYDDAFMCYQDGNRAAREMMAQRGITDNSALMMETEARTLRLYPQGTGRASIERLPIDLRMIFIVGLPRSGTSLVEQILSCHPDVAGGGELPFAQQCAAELERRRAPARRDSPVDVTDAADAALLEEMREKYLDGLFQRGLDAKVVTDKLPGNFAVLGFIRCIFPDAAIVHCSRDPLAVCWSLYTAYFGTHEPYYNSFEDLADYHRFYRRLMRHWETVLDPPVVEVRYEELVSNLEAVIPRLLTACRLSPEPACSEFHRSERPVFTASQLQVRRPLYTTSVARWRHYEKHIAPLRSLLQRSIAEDCRG